MFGELHIYLHMLVDKPLFDESETHLNNAKYVVSASLGLLLEEWPSSAKRWIANRVSESVIDPRLLIRWSCDSSYRPGFTCGGAGARSESDSRLLKRWPRNDTAAAWLCGGMDLGQF